MSLKPMKVTTRSGRGSSKFICIGRLPYLFFSLGTIFHLVYPVMVTCGKPGVGYIDLVAGSNPQQKF